MIVTLEGPDRAGKTTLYEALKGRMNAVFVSSLPMNERLIPLMHLVDIRQIELWKYLYDPHKLYICDRSPFVSGPVYAALRGTEYPDTSVWRDRVRVVYLAPSHVELERRHNATNDFVGMDNMRAVMALYDEHLTRWTHIRLSTGSVEQHVAEVERWIGQNC